MLFYFFLGHYIHILLKDLACGTNKEIMQKSKAIQYNKTIQKMIKFGGIKLVTNCQSP